MRNQWLTNPGTPEGRRLGGLRSLTTHKRKRTGFKTLREVPVPHYSVELAELMGILMGDGHLDKYQISMSTHSETDIEHAEFVVNLLTSVFGLPVSLRKRNTKQAVVVTLSSKAACEHLHALGMPRGNKLMKGLYPPTWIKENTEYTSAFMRGLIDTDGCVYQDRHTIRGRAYVSICIAFTSASSELLDFVEAVLTAREYHPTRWGRSIRLRRRMDVFRYASEIGFSNPKHARKIEV